MAAITVTAATLCQTGGDHVTLTGTVNGNARSVRVRLSDLLAGDPDDDDTLLDRAIARWRSAVREAGATTLLQARTAILNKTFQV